MTIGTAFKISIVGMVVIRVAIGVLLLTAMQEVDTVAYKLFMLGAGVWFIAYAVSRAIKMKKVLDSIKNGK